MEPSAVPFLSNAGNVWLMAAVLLLLAEAVGVPGIGLLFAGLAALVAGAAVYAGLVGPEAYIAQFAVFFAFSALWAALLWKPMQKFRGAHKRGGYSNIVGDVAVVAAGGLEKGTGGNVTWSGTIMKAELAGHSQRLEEGAQVVISDVRGATLVVHPK